MLRQSLPTILVLTYLSLPFSASFPSSLARRIEIPSPGSLNGHSRVYLVDCSSGPLPTDLHSSEIAYYSDRLAFSTTTAATAFGDANATEDGGPDFVVATDLATNTVWQNNGSVTNVGTGDVFAWTITQEGLPPGAEVGDTSLAAKIYTLVYGPGLLLYRKNGLDCQAVYTAIQVQGPR